MKGRMIMGYSYIYWPMVDSMWVIMNNNNKLYVAHFKQEMYLKVLYKKKHYKKHKVLHMKTLKKYQN